MLTYIIRRMLLMIPTLFGITVMVFLIARCAPGRPGEGQVAGGGGEISSEHRKALQEWYEKRYGLNLPLHEQYLRWWRGMFVRETQGKAWVRDKQGTLREIFTTRVDFVERFTVDPQGKWYVIRSIEPDEQTYKQDDPAFIKLIPAALRSHLVEIDPRYPIAHHVLAKANIEPIETLDESLLKPANITRKIDINLKAWTTSGYPLYDLPDKPRPPDSPDQPATYYFQRDGHWFSFESNESRDDWTIQPLDDPAFKAMVAGAHQKDLPPDDDDRPVPNYVKIRGEPKILKGKPPGTPQLFTPEIKEFAQQARLWTDNGWPIFDAEDLIPLMIVDDEAGNWQRFIGKTRLDNPLHTTYRQTNRAFGALLSEQQREKLPTIDPSKANQPIPNHVVLSGTMIKLNSLPAETDRRRYSHTVNIFEVTLGESQTLNTTVMRQLKDKLPVTLTLNLIALPIIYLIALPGGMLMAVKRGKLADTGSTVAMLALWSIPTVLTGTLLINYLTEGGVLGWTIFPTGKFKGDQENMNTIERMLDYARHLALPVLCMVYGSLAYLAKQMRASMLENLSKDYVRTARAKGVRGQVIVFKHVLCNSLIPIITIFATLLPALLGGSLIVEMLFDIEGMGLFFFRAIQTRDFDVIQSLTLVYSGLTLIGLLVADICYAIIDPRIRLR
jgi:peptide/nickel transport system permease protein